MSSSGGVGGETIVYGHEVVIEDQVAIERDNVEEMIRQVNRKRLMQQQLLEQFATAGSRARWITRLKE
jgi:hypothetical protein